MGNYREIIKSIFWAFAAVIIHGCASPAEVFDSPLKNQTEEKVEIKTSDLPSVPQNTQQHPEKASIANRKRKVVGKAYLAGAQAIDNFLSGRKIENRVDKSYLKLEGDYTFYRNQEDFGGSQLKFKLDLPKTEERMRLFFDSDLAQDDTLESNLRAISTRERVNDSGSIAGIELLPLAKKAQRYLKTSISIGAKFNDGIEGLFRIRTRNKETLFGRWQFFHRHEAMVLDGEGWRFLNRVEFKRPMTERLTFTAVTDSSYKEKVKEREYGHRWIFSQRHSPKLSSSYKLGHVKGGETSNEQQKHFFNITLSRVVIPNWLFVSLTPEVAYYRDFSLVNDRSVTLKVDMFFTE